MNFRKASITLGLAAVAATSIGFAPSAMAHDTEVHTIKASGLDLSQSRIAGHTEFLQDKLFVWTDDNSSQAKAAGYFSLVGYSFPTSGSLEWNGSQPQPGQQLIFDLDGETGNGNDYNVLVGEPVYGDNWWLTSLRTVDPAKVPHIGGGNGSDYYGTLTEWAQAYPDARPLAGGYSLGSGIKGQGFIKSITYNDHKFVFAGTPGPEGPKGDDGDTGPEGPKGDTGSAPALVTANVTGHSGVTRLAANKVKIVLTSDARADGTKIGAKLRWVVKADGRVLSNNVQGFDARDAVVARFAAKSGKHTVTVTKNGKVVRTITVRTGR